MAGITDRPFRRLARRFGAGARRLGDGVARGPSCAARASRACASTTPASPAPFRCRSRAPILRMLAEAARYNVERGAQIIDINMGCPAKKVCNVAPARRCSRTKRWSARILEAVVGAVDVPVTLKIRTGPDPQQRNAVRIARIAEAAGMQMLAVHGRTRACAVRRRGRIRHDRRGEVARRHPGRSRTATSRTPEQAKRVLAATPAPTAS